jgi:hypothetical protein
VVDGQGVFVVDAVDGNVVLQTKSAASCGLRYDELADVQDVG